MRCRYCGQRIPEGELYCRHCGKEIADDSRFCPICGAEVTGASSNQPEKKSESLKVRKSIMMAGGLIVIALGISAYFLSGQMKTGSSINDWIL